MRKSHIQKVASHKSKWKGEVLYSAGINPIVFDSPIMIFGQKCMLKETKDE
jgi:hypothetical protein